MKKKSFLFAGFILLALTGCQEEVQTQVGVIPQPLEVAAKNSYVSFNLPLKYATNLNGQEAVDLTTYMEGSEWTMAKTNGQEADLTLTLVDSISGLNSPEAYRLEINTGRITIEATTAAGLFYGYQTLNQLKVEQDQKVVTFQETSITDAPRFGYRGIMLDVSRHFRDKEFIKRQLDAMARYKLNRFHWHLTDGAGWRIEIKRYPELTEQAAYRPYANWKAWWKGGRKYCKADAPQADGGYYTQADIKEVLEYARLRHITVIPEIEMPGHSEEVLAVMPKLACTGKPFTASEFCVGNEATFTFLQNVLLEVIDLFPSEYIHIGGDEADKSHWKKCRKCQARMRKEGLKDEKELQSYLIHRMEKFLNEHGKKLIGWDEILEGGLAPEATVMSWRGEEGGIKAAKAGHDVIMTPGSHCYFDSYQDAPTMQPEAIGGYLTLEKVYSYDPESQELTDEEKKLVLGVQANLWTEYIPTEEHLEYMLYPRALALAEVAWSEPERKDWTHFRETALKEVTHLQETGYHPFDLHKEVGEREVAKTPVENLAKGKAIVYNCKYADQYTAGGDSALIDGVRGGWTYLDHKWQGFCNQDMDVTIDLGEEIFITSISAEFMQLMGPYVWLPKEVVFSVSTDGKEFTEVSRERTDVPTTEEHLTFETYGWKAIGVKGAKKVRYVRCLATSNGINGGWIFTDEIIIQ